MERRDRDTEKRALISEEAAEWLIRLRDEKLGSVDRLRYAQWLKQSPGHIAEMLRLAGLDGYLHVHKLRAIGGSEMPSNVVELKAHVTEAGTYSTHDTSGRRLWFTNWLNWKFATGFSAVALSIMGIVVMINFFWRDSNIDTDSGEWRRIKLSDGSIVNVGPRSHVSFDFSDKTRRDVFLSRGEALFNVAKNPDRPFFVSTDLAIVRAVGTQFGVTRRGDHVSVTVKEGKVAVTQGGVAHHPVSETNNTGAARSPENSPVPLVADEQITVTAAAWPVAPRRIDADKELAWVQGQFFFEESTTVAQAAEEFNRRNRVQIIVEDPEVAAQTVCCMFNIDDPESFAQSVASGSRKHDVRLVHEGTSALRLTTVESRISE